MANDPNKLDTPEYSPEELKFARACIRFERARFRLNISYAEKVEFTTTSNIRGDVGPLGGTPETPDNG